MAFKMKMESSKIEKSIDGFVFMTVKENRIDWATVIDIKWYFVVTKKIIQQLKQMDNRAHHQQQQRQWQRHQQPQR